MHEHEKNDNVAVTPKLVRQEAVHGAEDADDEKGQLSIALRKVSWVILPVSFFCGVTAYLDKGNLSFAALQLNADLGLSPVDYGLGSGLFYLGFAVGILPSTFMTMRYGARRWLGFLTISWGVVSACHALMSNKVSFCILRVLLGLIEGGGPSSGGHLLAQFYPRNKRAMPFTVVILSAMVSGIFAAPLAAGLMQLHGQGGLRGWQWLFLIEGIPSVVLGVAIMIWLPSQPLTAWMLTDHQRELLHQTVHESTEDADAARTPPRVKQVLPLLWDAAKRPALWYFVAIAFLWTLSSMSLQQWLPVLINNMLSGTALSGSTSSGVSAAAAKASSQQTEAILLSGIPPVCGAIGMLVTAWHSDRVNEQNWHVAIPFVVSGIVLTLFTPFYKLAFAGGFAVLVISITLANCSQGVFNSRVVACLDTRHAGIGLALYTAVCGLLAGFTGPLITGAFVQKTGSFSGVTVLDGVLIIAAGLLMAGLAVWERWASRTSLSGRQVELAADSGQQAPKEVV